MLSTILAVWGIYKDVRDRGNVRVEAYLSEWDDINEETNERARKYEVEIILTNIGRRSVLVHSVGFGVQRGVRLYLWRRLPAMMRVHRSPPKDFYEAILDVGGSLPKRLDAGEFISIKRDNLLFLQDRESIFFALDSLGHYYFLPKSAWNRMLKNYHPATPNEATVDHLIGKVRF
jgi:hypothetical protein